MKANETIRRIIETEYGFQRMNNPIHAGLEADMKNLLLILFILFALVVCVCERNPNCNLHIQMKYYD